MHSSSVEMIFERIVIRDPQILTHYGFCCFESFCHVYYDDDKQREKCINFFWNVILNSKAQIAHKARVSMMNMYTKLTRERHGVRSGQRREEVPNGVFHMYNVCALMMHTCTQKLERELVQDALEANLHDIMMNL